MFIENKYFKIYHQIIDRAKGFNFSSRVAAKKYHGYVERHHIIPKSLGGPDTTSNLVYLTAREHFICHMLLVRFTVGADRRKMVFAINKMTRKSKNQNRHIPKSHQYANIRTEFSKSVSEQMTEYSKGRNYSGENNPFYGKTHDLGSLEHMSKIKIGKNNPNYGVTQLPEWNKSKSDSQIGIAKPILVCENCQQEVGGHGNYKRWHGVNCKKIKVLEPS